MRKNALAVGLTAAGLLGCGAKDRVSVSDYDTSCTVDADCVLIRVGACSEHCGLPMDYVTINVRDEERWRRDYDALDCGRGDWNCAAPPAPAALVCDGGTCAMQY
jgi:hypothetical protein